MNHSGKRIISFGSGVQTVALTVLNCLKDERLLDVTGGPAWFGVFADTQWETSATYEYYSWFVKWCIKHNFPIFKVGCGNLRADALDTTKHRFASMPLFTKNEYGKRGMLRRQCTREYKIEPVDRFIRSEVFNVRRMTEAVDLWFGITTDEISRVKPAKEKWKNKVFPFIDMLWSRSSCEEYLGSVGMPIPPKSACIGCPFHGNAQWMDLKNNHPRDWLDAVEFDRKVRNLTQNGVMQPAYLHEQCVPLDEANLNENQINMFNNECEGMCGV